MWDGKISNYQDLALNILSPGLDIPLSTPSEKSSESSSKEASELDLDASTDLQPASSRFTFDSLSELSFVKIWNYFTNANPSTRNLYLNIGFWLGSQILWILPTFFGTIPEERTDERLGGISDQLNSLHHSDQTT